MSACSDFVEHVWKPGSCKNCFNPKSSHRPRTGPAASADGARPQGPMPNDEGVATSAFSKPTIAVKPTMISSDVSDTWADVNADLAQVMINPGSGGGCRTASPHSPLVGSTGDACWRSSLPTVSPPGLVSGSFRRRFWLNEAVPVGHLGARRGTVCVEHVLCSSFAFMYVLMDSSLGAHAGQLGAGQAPPPESRGCAADLPRRLRRHTGALRPLRAPRPGPHRAERAAGPNVPRPSGRAAKVGDRGDLLPCAAGPDRRRLDLELSSSPQTEGLGAALVEPPRGDPIYAESSKRRKAQAKGPGGRAAARREGAEREHHDVGGQVAARITVMAAHTEDEHRTIFLSSPDSAVGVQWPCVSPASHGDFGSSSPALEPTETLQAPGSDSSPRLHLAAPAKAEGPAIPPKMSKSSQPGGEGTRAPLDSAVVARFGDGNSHDGSGTQLMLQSHTDMGACGTSPPPCAHVPAEEASRGLTGERRPKSYAAAWSKQCRIEEEEEEEEEQLATPPRAGRVGERSAGAHLADDCPMPESRTGISKSSSFSFDFPKDKGDFAPPPPPPPKKQSRHALKMEPCSTELERVSSSSAESLSPPFRSVHVSFTAGSSDSLDSDARTGSDGGHSLEPNHSPPVAESRAFPPMPFAADPCEDSAPSDPSDPPPLPQKKTVSRALSSPDGFCWGPSSSAIAAGTRLNVSHSDSNVCLREEPPLGYPACLGGPPGAFSSSESLDRGSKGNGSWDSAASRSTGSCMPSRNHQALSSSQLSVSSQASSGSSLQLHNLLSNIESKEGVYAKLGALYAESVRRLVAKCEDCFMREQKNELHFSENNWSLFKLTCNKPCCDSGDAIYYCATCSKDPGTTYAVKV
ncbi:Tyrosine-protein kinase SgK223, partial [Tinamus guttatus]